MFSAPFLATLLDRVKAIVRRVAGAERARRGPSGSGVTLPPTAPIPPLTRALARSWLSARLRALSALMARIDARVTLDRLGAPRRPAKRTGVSIARVAVPPEERLPRGFGWMCGFEPHLREDGAAFAAWLSEPAMTARVFAEPERMARVIGPILTATGTCHPAWFPKASKRERNACAPDSGMKDARAVGDGASDVADPGSGLRGEDLLNPQSRGISSSPVVRPTSERKSCGIASPWARPSERSRDAATPARRQTDAFPKMRHPGRQDSHAQFVAVLQHIPSRRRVFLGRAGLF
jgi:hypothetical protein